MNGRLILGIVDIMTGIAAIIMAIYFIFLKGNGLKSIIYHLFFSWSAQYLVIGFFTFGAFITGNEIIPINDLRLLTAVFVLSQFLALLRLFFYIHKTYGQTSRNSQ